MVEVATCLEAADESFIDYVSSQHPDTSHEAELEFLSSLQSLRDDNVGPIENFVSQNSFNSFFTKAISYTNILNSGSDGLPNATFSELDIFAYNLFLSNGFYAVMNEDFEILVGGTVFNMLSMAVGQTGTIVSPPVQAGPFDCWEWNLSGENRYFDNPRRKLEMRNSHFIIGSFVVFRGTVRNARRRFGTWWRTRENLQVGFQGIAKWNGTCIDIADIAANSTISRTGSRSVYRIRFRPSGSAKANETWIAIATNFSTGHTGTYVY